MSFNKFCPFNKSQFILHIGEESAELRLIKNGSTVTSAIVHNNHKDSWGKFTQILLQAPKLPIYILLNQLDQSYEIEDYPALNRFTLSKALKTRLAQHYSHNKLYAALNLGKTPDKKQWQVLFASCSHNDVLDDWFDFIMNKDNPISGFYLLPIEVQPILKHLTLSLDKRVSGIDHWQFLVINSALSGMRFIAYKNQHLMFARLINKTTGEELAEAVTTLVQEIANSIHYAERMAFSAATPFETFLIISPEIKNALIKQKLVKPYMTLYTNFEAAQQLSIVNAVAEDEPYADSLIASFVAQSCKKPLLRLQSAAINKLYTLTKLKGAACFSVSLALLVLVGYIGSDLYKIYRHNQQITQNNSLKATNTRNLKQLNEDLSEIENAHKITDLYNLYKLLTVKRFTPFELINKFCEMKETEVQAKSINFNMSDNLARIDLVLNFYDKSDDLDQLLNNIDLFIERVKKQFTQFDVTYDKIHAGLDLNKENDMIPLQLTISQKKEMKLGSQ